MTVKVFKNGEVIEYAETLKESRQYISDFEAEDIENEDYSVDFYEIYDNFEGEVVE